MINNEPYYDKVYFLDFRNHAVKFFYNAERRYPNVNMKFLFNLYFISKARYEAEKGSPYYLNLASGELLDEFEEKGLIDRLRYPKSDKTIENYYGDAMMWAIMQWSDLTFRYKVYSKDLIKLMSFDDLLLAFEVGHERSFSSESEVLYDRFIKDRFNEN